MRPIDPRLPELSATRRGRCRAIPFSHSPSPATVSQSFKGGSSNRSPPLTAAALTAVAVLVHLEDAHVAFLIWLIEVLGFLIALVFQSAERSSQPSTHCAAWHYEWNPRSRSSGTRRLPPALRGAVVHQPIKPLMATVVALLMLLIFPTLYSKADGSAPSARNFFESILEYSAHRSVPSRAQGTHRYIRPLPLDHFLLHRLRQRVLGCIPFPISSLNSSAADAFSTLAVLPPAPSTPAHRGPGHLFVLRHSLLRRRDHRSFSATELTDIMPSSGTRQQRHSRRMKPPWTLSTCAAKPSPPTSAATLTR